MLNDFTGADQVYIACGYTDLRKGIDGLARLVQQQFALDPFTNTLFLFCGRRRDRIKGLYWEKDGFILLYKRLEQGAYQWPRSESEVMLLLPTFQAGAGDCRADTGCRVCQGRVYCRQLPDSHQHRKGLRFDC
jgi:transposase